jgi:ABC-type iron transport system FetAB ATPase subunit
MLLYMDEATSNLNEIERQALDMMLAEAVREKNSELFQTIQSGNAEQIQALLDRFFR